jgi:hypothetical protein
MSASPGCHRVCRRSCGCRRRSRSWAFPRQDRSADTQQWLTLNHMKRTQTFATSFRFHCPTQGPHELLRIVAPAASNSSKTPSRSTVARIFSLPAVINTGIFGFNPASRASRKSTAALLRSSKDEFVQLPIIACEISFGQVDPSTSPANADKACERSGVKGPLMCGSRVLRFISMISS